jgi:hypothetical protein
MKRTMTAFALAAIAAATLTAPAAAKEMSVALATSPPTLGPGEPWNAKLLVHGVPDILSEAAPGITIRGPGGEERTFTARRTGKRAADGQLLYRAKVVFPSEGRWSYQLLDGVTDRAYEGGTVTIGDGTAPAAAPSAPADEAAPAQAPVPAGAATSDGAFPLWPLLGGLLLVGVAAGGTLVLVRRSRLATR